MVTRIKLGDIDVDVVLKDIKNIHLSVHPPSGRVRISAPARMNLDTIRAFAISKLAWIKKHRRKFQEQERETAREYLDRESHYFFGKRYLLRVFEDSPRAEVRLTKSTIDLYVRKGASLSKREEIMNEWYRKELKKAFPELLEKWEKRIGVSASTWGIKSMKTRWGSCNRKAKRIWINLELAKKPPICLEYVIVHELVHILEGHHNDTFKKYMDAFMPQWRRYKDQLNRFPISHNNWKY